MHTVTVRALSSSVLFLLYILLVKPLPARAAIQCYECHGTIISPSSGDLRPVDAPYRNVTTGGFQGNHRTHMDDVAGPATCAICHPGSSDYTQGHRNGVITIAFNINSSPLRAVYRNGSTTFPQTPFPKLGSCSNVNCHFERETRIWGAATLAVPSGCAECHGSPPNGGDGGAAGSHATHDLYYPGIAGCGTCHADHSQQEKPFSHATSAGRTLSLTIQNPVSSVRAFYSGNMDDYLPKSSTNSFGSCSNIYCHSRGDSSTAYLPNVQPVWGGSLPADCSGCHGNGHGTGAEVTSGSHTMHVGKDYYGQYVYVCGTCHSSTASGNTEITNRSNHANRKIDVAVSSPFGGSYSADGHAPGAAVGSCQNVYCHSNVQPDGGIGGPTAYANPVWGDASSINCGGCHAGDGGHNGHGSGAKMTTGSHAKHLTYGFTTTSNTVRCMVCHKYTDYPFITTSCMSNPNGNIICHASGTSKWHSNGTIEVRLDPTFGNMSAYQGGTAPGNGYSNCANTYCHSSGVSVSTGIIPPSTTTTWGSGTLACDACHGNPPGYLNRQPKANSHVKHNSYSCSRCHYGTTTTGTTITSTTLHVNKAFTVSGPPETPITYTFSASGGTCSANSCHNDGTSISTGIDVFKSATWGSAASCGACHGENSSGRPVYANGSPKANQHLIPVHRNSCDVCHYSTTTNGFSITNIANHQNGSYDYAVKPPRTSQYIYSPTGSRCLNTSCHATPEGSRRWGAEPSDCDGCHESPPNTSSHMMHFSGTVLQASYTSVSMAGDTSAGYLYNCANCHPRDFNRHRDSYVDVELYDPYAPAGSLKALNSPDAEYAPATPTLYDSRNYPYSDGTCNNVYCHGL